MTIHHMWPASAAHLSMSALHREPLQSQALARTQSDSAAPIIKRLGTQTIQPDSNAVAHISQPNSS
eukprot:5830971-Amphidinium_carterae.1